MAESPGAKPPKAEKRSDLNAVVSDFKFAQEGRPEREAQWDKSWARYLVQARKKKQAHRSNAVSPHGGLVIRDMLPLMKKIELSTNPFIRAKWNKEEVRDLAPVINKMLASWLLRDDMKHKLLTLQQKASLIFGIHFGIVDHVENVREMPWTEDERQAAREAGIELDQYEVLSFGPNLLSVNIEDAYPDPTGESIESLLFFANRMFLPLSKLQLDDRYDQDALAKLKKEGAEYGSKYQLPLEDIFSNRRRRVLGMSSDRFEIMARRQHAAGDPMIEVIQHFSPDGSLVAIANQALVIRRETLDHPFPIYTLVPDPIPGELYGKSIFHDAQSSMEQRDFTLNKFFESIKNAVDHVVVAVPGVVSKSAIRNRQSGVIWAADINGIKEMRFNNIIGDMMGGLHLLDGEIQMGTGLSDPVSRMGPKGAVYNESATTTLRKEDNAQGPIMEMVSNVERGFQRVARIIFDIESRYVSEEDFIRVAGELGARWSSIDFDTIASSFDFEVLGSRYHQTKQAEVEAIMTATPLLLQIGQLEPGSVSPRALARAIVDAFELPDKERIVPSNPMDQGPEAEHSAMKMGLRVKPDAGENHEEHLQAHAAELEKAQGEDAEDRYIALLHEHLIDHMREFEEQQAQQQMQAAMMAAGGAPGGVPTIPQ